MKLPVTLTCEGRREGYGITIRPGICGSWENYHEGRPLSAFIGKLRNRLILNPTVLGYFSPHAF